VNVRTCRGQRLCLDGDGVGSHVHDVSAEARLHAADRSLGSVRYRAGSRARRPLRKGGRGGGSANPVASAPAAAPIPTAAMASGTAQVGKCFVIAEDVERLLHGLVFGHRDQHDISAVGVSLSG
jgi:hypothetical protein